MIRSVELVYETSQNDKLSSLLRNYGFAMYKPLNIDLRIVLNWNMDMTDLELHVFEVKSTACFEFISFDFTAK